MKKWTKATVLAAALFATVAAPLAEASAGRRHHGYGHGYNDYNHRPHYNKRHRSRRGDAAAAGIIGLGIGAIIGSALTQQSSPPPRVIYRDPPQRVYGGYAPWSPGWYDYCTRRYRSFNPDTGTFRGYDGRDHFCNAP